MSEINKEKIVGYEDMDFSIYFDHARTYIPKSIIYLLIAESPPAFNGEIPESYFYFSDCPKADILFYTVVKAIFRIDFKKGIHDRVFFLNKLKEEGVFLIDSVEYPINKDKQNNKISNIARESIIQDNIPRFIGRVNELAHEGSFAKNTKSILIKETVFNQIGQLEFLNVVNEKPIRFPNYVKDEVVVQELRKYMNYT